MKTSRRNKLAGLGVFLLLAFVVLGGMAWATVSSLELARRNVTEEHQRLVSRALWQMDSHIGGILFSEAARKHSDYWRIHVPREGEVVAVYAPGSVELDVARVVLHSPLAVSDPPQDWIDLYFEWDPNEGEHALTSPQLADAQAVWPLENLRTYSLSEVRARRTMDWLAMVLPTVDLHDRLAGICRHDRSFARAADEPEATQPGQSATLANGRWNQSPLSRDYQRRKESLRDSQFGYLPSTCLDPSDAMGASGTWGANSDGGGIPSVGDARLTFDPLTAFWLEPGPDGGQRLAFVREGHWLDRVFWQGFVGDWKRLRPQLLGVVADLLPEADLLPVLDESELDAEASETQMINLPVRLEVPDLPGGASAAAWQRVRRPLIGTWVAAVAVLGVAGLGLRNLVALTERRMQFAYAVTHELRTPLTTFRLYTDMLSAGLVPDASRQEYLETLDREALRLSSLVENVLEYARLENHRVRLNFVDTNGASLIAGLIETLDRRCKENGIAGRTENAVSNGHALRTDVELLHRIVGVLIQNACRHARGSPNASVLVRLSDNGPNLHVDVIDTGPGIDRREVRTIFKPFRRGHGADAAAQGGIGLGLALARTWADLLHGRLELAARHDPHYGGAHFRLTIPSRFHP